MSVNRFIPEDPYSPPNIPVLDMNLDPYVYQGKYLFAILPLPWYSVNSGDTRDRFDLRVLPDTELAALGWTPAPPQPSFNPETETVQWDEEVGEWVVSPIPQPEEPVL
tara:strand:- start:27 stop:350 length:324 start_codon:yes stop_codon:yes gene_type:complete